MCGICGWSRSGSGHCGTDTPAEAKSFPLMLLRDFDQLMQTQKKMKPSENSSLTFMIVVLLF